MEYLIPSFFAGVLTVLAPCVITLLPIILSGSLGEKDPLKPLIVAGSLSLSVIVFTLLLKATTLLIAVPTEFWRSISGILIILFGVTMVAPVLWEKLAFKMKLYKSEGLLNKSAKKNGRWGSVLLGVSLGPVFTTCSPTFAVILAIILPANFGVGFVNLAAYSLGLFLILIFIGYGGRKITNYFKFAANPNGLFKRGLGVLLITTGLLVITGYDKAIESMILQSGYNGATEVEASIIESFDSME